MKKFKRLRQTPNGLITDKSYTFTTQLILNEAEKSGYQIESIPDTPVVKLTKGKKSRYFYRQSPAQLNSALSEQITNDKQATKNFLKLAGISISPGFVLKRRDLIKDWKAAYQKLEKPLVIKPIDGSHGDGVYIKIKSWPDFKNKVSLLFQSNHKVLVEEMFDGTEFRLTATHQKCLAITKRVPAFVKGDGQSTLAQLIQLKNENRAETMMKGSLVKIKIDQESSELLKNQKVDLNTIIADGQKIKLKKVSNLSAGGDSIDLTDATHPSIKKLAIQTIQAIPGLKFGGVDLLCQDITQPIENQKYCIIELNSSPAFSMAEMPAKGQHRAVAKEFLRLLFAD